MGFNTVIGSGGSDKVNTAVLNQIHVDGVFVKTTPMGTAPNVVYRIGDGTVHPEGWDNVLDNEYLDFYISFTSDADFAGISLVGTNILDVIKVANDIVSVVTVAGDIVSVITTAGDTIAINAVYNDLVKGIGTNQPTDSAILNALTNANQTIADAASTAADRVATTQDALDTAADVVSTNADVVSSGANATNAQLYEWEAEAERLTADSYATEAEDTFVNLVTSDGDGTFTYTPTTDYSALHWAAKSMAGDIAPIIHAATAKTTPVDADEFAITDSAATFGLKKLTWANLKTTITALRETKVAMGANDIALASGSLFTKTITATTTLTVSGWLASGNVNSFILELTNGGAFAVTYFAGVKWAGGTAPTLTAAGVDILGFYSHDGGTTVRGILLSKDSK